MPTPLVLLSPYCASGDAVDGATHPPSPPPPASPLPPTGPLLDGLNARARAAGFTVVLVTVAVPVVAAAAAAGGGAPPLRVLDAVVDGLRSTLLSAGVGSPPPALVAPGPLAALAQKYLESWPAAALVALAPTAPAGPRAGAARAWPAGRAGEGALGLLRLLAAPGAGVRLEPAPVRTLLVAPRLAARPPGARDARGRSARLLEPDDADETMALHELDPDDGDAVLWVDSPARGRGRDGGEAGAAHERRGEEGEDEGRDGDELVRALWGLPSPAGQRVADDVVPAVMRWLERRF